MTVSFGHSTAPCVDMVPASWIQLVPPDWLWKYWIAKGTLTVLAGAPGTGKTTLALDIAATLSKGGGSTPSVWPDGSSAPYGRTLIWSTEDRNETLAARIRAAGATGDDTYFLRGIKAGDRSRAFDASKDLRLLKDEIQAKGPFALIIVDPISQAIVGNTNKAADVRRGLEQLMEAAGPAAVLGIAHLTKGSSKKPPIERVQGSTALVGVARTVLMTGRVEGDEDDTPQPPTCVLVRAKSNIGPDDGGHRYRILNKNVMAHDGGNFESSMIDWDPALLHGNANRILSEATGGATSSTKHDEAIAFLRLQLCDGPKVGNEVARIAEAHRIASITLRRAREHLNVQSTKQLLESGTMAHVWSLPTEVPHIQHQTAYGAPSQYPPPGAHTDQHAGLMHSASYPQSVALPNGNGYASALPTAVGVPPPSPSFARWRTPPPVAQSAAYAHPSATQSMHATAAPSNGYGPPDYHHHLSAHSSPHFTGTAQGPLTQSDYSQFTEAPGHDRSPPFSLSPAHHSPNGPPETPSEMPEAQLSLLDLVRSMPNGARIQAATPVVPVERVERVEQVEQVEQVGDPAGNQHPNPYQNVGQYSDEDGYGDTSHSDDGENFGPDEDGYGDTSDPEQY